MMHTQLQQRWQAYEDHAEKVKRQEENKREKELAEKAKRMRRREKLFILLQNREEGIHTVQEIGIFSTAWPLNNETLTCWVHMCTTPGTNTHDNLGTLV